jgi:hypothetical protein
MSAVRGRVTVRIATVALPMVALAAGAGCLGQAERTYFDDLPDGAADATTITTDGATPFDGQDSEPANEASAGDDGGGDEHSPVDASSPDGSVVADAALADAADAADGAPADAAPEASPCGPTDTVTNCGACGSACDKTHSSPVSCTAAACIYSGCDAGWGDCIKTAPNANGCETQLNSVTNCTGCNVACDTTQSTGAACNGKTCSYSACKTGFLDCNAATAPNADGCETAMASAQHSTGIPGISYYDCAPRGTYGLTQALEACTAYTGDGSQCATFACTNTKNGPIVCSTGALAKDCECWSYGGLNAGYVDNSGGPPGATGANCFCPSTTLDPMWN